MKKKNKSIYRVLELGEERLEYELFLGSYKNINLRVREDGSIRVSANQRIPRERIDCFLLEKMSWIENARQRISESNTLMSGGETPWRNGGVLPMFGRERTILVSCNKKSSAYLDGDVIRVSVQEPSEEKIRRAVLRMAERELKEYIDRLYPCVLNRFADYGVIPPQVRFRYMVSRWGSCCPAKKTVTLNRFLFLASESCIEYVIVHELSHMLELNHSSAFWAIVEKAMPDWKEQKRDLARYGVLLKRL